MRDARVGRNCQCAPASSSAALRRFPRHSEIVKSLIGLPYVFNGRDPKEGVDCIGLTLLYFRELLGADAVADPLDAGKDPHAFARWRGAFVWAEPPYQTGDVLLMKEWSDQSGPPAHLALALPQGILHADSGFGYSLLLPWRHVRGAPERIMRHRTLAAFYDSAQKSLPC